MRLAMVMDIEKCLGCKTCTVACCMENNVFTNDNWNVVLDTIEAKDWRNPVRKFYPRPCMHCDKPGCVSACPTGASHIIEKTGTVQIDYDICIGCRACMTGCPYNVRVFNFKQAVEQEPKISAVKIRPVGVVEKCTFCKHRVDKALKEGKQIGTTKKQPDNDDVVVTACVRECVGNARFFGDLDDPNSEVSMLLKNNAHRAIRLVEGAGTAPKVYFLEPDNS